MSILSALDRLKHEIEVYGPGAKIRIFLDDKSYYHLNYELSEIQRIENANHNRLTGEIILFQRFIIEHESVYAKLVNELAREQEKTEKLEKLYLD